MPARSDRQLSLAPRVHVITLGVSDLERGLSFYRDGLGLPSRGIVGTKYLGDDDTPAGAIAMFQLDDGLVLNLYPRPDLAKDAGIDSGEVQGSPMSIGQIVDTREDVDRLLDLARRAGGRVHGSAHERPWGIYSGYFSDPDGHLWEIIYRLPTAPPEA